MEIRENNKVYIIAPLCSKLDVYSLERVEKEMLNEQREVALDLSHAQDCTIEFIEGLKAIAKNKSFGIFNVPSDIFVTFNFMNMDKYVKLFVSELDFEEDTRQLINRKFKLVDSF